jgi:hypothetical protein
MTNTEIIKVLQKVRNEIEEAGFKHFKDLKLGDNIKEGVEPFTVIQTTINKQIQKLIKKTQDGKL